jgi:NAD-dependent SIR2 family protein deacetylase
MTESKPSVTVLTGAGASKPLGLPTMEALLPEGLEAQLDVEQHHVFDMAADWAAAQNSRRAVRR